MNDENKYLQLLAKVLSKEASEEQEQQLQEWANQTTNNKQLVEETKLIWEKAEEGYNTNINTNKEAAWTRINASISAPKIPIKALWYKVAAAILVVFMGLGWLYQAVNLSKNQEVQPVIVTITTGKTEKKEIHLPDGSTIVLNEHSTLSYVEDFEKRLVNLEGEAFFEIAKRQGRSFEVLTNKTRTTVLGTSFNMRAYANQATEISVITGNVAFEALDRSKEAHVLLSSQEQATYQIREGIVKEQLSDNNVLAWKTQQLEFNNQPLSAVLSILERYYAVEIDGSEELLNCHYTGTFKRANLEQVLHTIAFTFPTTVNIEKIDDKYLLTGQGCD